MKLLIVWVLFWGQHTSYFETKAEYVALETQVRPNGYYIVPCHKEIWNPQIRPFESQP